jgi:hypothetical protein
MNAKKRSATEGVTGFSVFSTLRATFGGQGPQQDSDELNIKTPLTDAPK